MNSLKEYNSKINHSVVCKMIDEGLVEQVGFKFRLAGRRATH